jgi:hypothetical protein
MGQNHKIYLLLFLGWVGIYFASDQRALPESGGNMATPRQFSKFLARFFLGRAVHNIRVCWWPVR